MIGSENSRQAIGTGIALMLVGTMCASGADAALKAVATKFDAPQILLIAAMMSIALTFVANISEKSSRVLTTGAPKAMAGRAIATVLAAVGFYHAFVLIPFAEVFLFIGAMPLMAAALSGPILGEKVDGRVWGILGLGFLGLFCLFPTLLDSNQWMGHAYAALGSIAGTVSVVLSRHIGRHNTHSLAQVFYPQFAVALVMAMFLPDNVQPMSWSELGLVTLYSFLLFSGRWIMVIVARLLPAWLTLQLLNLQFVWMVIIGVVIFDETTGPYVFIGAGLIILAGTLLSRGELQRSKRPAIPDEPRNSGSAMSKGVAMVRYAAKAAD